MGYHGYGLIKELYTRKPKKSFKKMKDRYGEMIEDVPIGTDSSRENQTDYDELISYRKKVRSKGKVYRLFTNFLLLKGILAMLYLIFLWIGEKIL